MRSSGGWLNTRRAALGALMSLVLVLTSCTSLSRQTLIVWHSLRGGPARALETLIDQWNARGNAYVVAEYRESGSQHAALLDAIEADARRPDLVLASAQQTAIYQQRGALLPLDRFIDGPEGFKPNDKADLFPFVLNAGKTPAGEVIALPMGGDARVMYVNKAWLDDQRLTIPETWEQFDAVCDSVSERTVDLPCLGTVADDVVLQEWLLAHGLRVLSLSGSAQLTAPEVEAVLLPLLNRRGADQLVLGVSEQQIRDAFAAGQLVFVFDWSSGLGRVDERSRLNDNTNWVVAPLPATAGVPSSIQRANYWVIPKQPADDSAHPHAWRFLRWLYEQEQTAQWSLDTNELPVRVSAISRLDADRLPRGFLSVVQQIGARTQGEPLLETWPCARDTLATTAIELLNTDVYTEVLRRGQLALEAVLYTDCPAR
jgi:ABC-type glycerol-3-phosphate transport system substrate-binding protein